jgi:N6-adenosine-specific RNA methylase IME4
VNHSPFEELPCDHFGAILADPPWYFETWSQNGRGRSADKHYATMQSLRLYQMPVASLAAPNCVLFMWSTWSHLRLALSLIDIWGFQYKSCAFCWLKPQIGLGYWTRARSEPCLLATRGKPKRINADVRQGIIAARREHSRKPDEIHERIERLVAGPYLELFARQSRPGWTTWGDEKTKFDNTGCAASVRMQGGRILFPRTRNELR